METIFPLIFHARKNYKKCTVKLIICLLGLFFEAIHGGDMKVKLTYLHQNGSESHFVTLPLREPVTLDPKINYEKSAVYIIHGFLIHRPKNVPWMAELGLAYMSVKKVNVFLVDWGSGAKTFNYYKAVRLTRKVAKMLDYFISYMHYQYGTPLYKTHIIGHSLGAHIAGFIGKGVPNIGRITGLDPARPEFRNPEDRLKRGDAVNVDVLHTNALHYGLGLPDSIGDVDFFFNGGSFQPGCPGRSNSIIVGVFGFILDYFRKFVCSHSRAIDYFIESLSSRICEFHGSADPNKPEQDAAVVGIRTFSVPRRGNYYIKTHPKEPFCIVRLNADNF